MENSVEQNPTPDTGGASTLDPLDRLEKLLSAESGSDNDQPETEDQSADDVTPDGDGQQAEEPQITTSDLAKFLGLEDGVLDLDEDGTVKLKTKVDGVEGTAKLQDLIKSYQLQEHVDKRAREAAEREKALQTRQQEVEQQFTQRIQYAEKLADIATNQLLQDFQSIDWRALEMQDAGQAALLKQKFQERQAQLQGVYYNIEQDKVKQQQTAAQERQKLLQAESAKLPQVVPEWKDEGKRAQEMREIRDWAVKQGFDAQEVDSIPYANYFGVMRKAMLYDKLQQSKPAIENKVRKAPVIVKPGQPQQDSQVKALQNLKLAVKKSGGKGGTIEELLIRSGKV